jgi:TonB-dependent receptor
VTEEMVTRFSYSQTLARPLIGAMGPVRSFIANPKVGNRKADVGNPGLIPYLSDNFDLSFEWYYGEGSFVSVGYFYKIVDNFLQSTTTQEAYEGILDPYIGVQAELAREQLAAEGVELTDNNVFARINSNLGVAATTPIRAEPGDPLVVWDVTTTTNAEAGTIDGFELQVQHMFGDSGFGLQANATFVNGDINADRDVIGIQFALQGLSDTANLIGFYENEHISARLAYNWRDEFLSGFDQHDAPIFVEEYSSLDLNFTWFATENLSVFVEGVNITEETQRTYVRYPEQFLRGNQYGARYNIGASYRF